MPDRLREWLDNKLCQSYVSVSITIVGRETYRMEVNCKEDMGLVSPVLLDYYVVNSSAPVSPMKGVTTHYDIKISKEYE